MTSIVSESMPHLKKGALRDFKNIMKGHNVWKENEWGETDKIYTFPNGSQIEFFGADQADKLRGGRRDRLFINEANNISFQAFEELEVRTKEFIYADWNPVSEFWFDEEVKGKRNDVDFIILNYLDNEALPEESKKSIEQRKNRKDWWQVFGLGQLGQIDGKIYSNWQIIDSVPHEARLERYGVDFGYTNDPTCIVSIYRYNSGYILDEIIYQKGLSNKQIADTFSNLEKCLIIADSAEPKSIDEIKSYGVNIQPAQKGKDSIRQGIQLVQEQQISVTKRSINIIKEYRNYLWQKDKDGRILNEPEGIWNHCFSPETLIHTTKGKKRIDELVGKSGHLYSKDGRVERFYNVRPTRKNTEVVSLIFNTGEVLTITLDHLLLLPTGEWIESQLLCPGDMIQSVTHETRIQWNCFYKIFSRKLLQRICEWREMVSTSLYMVYSQWFNTKALPYPSQRREQGQQQLRKLGIKTQNSSFIRAYDTRTQSQAEVVDRKNKTSCEQVAWIKRGDRLAQVTWQEDNGAKKTPIERMFSLPHDIWNNTVLKINTILRTKLQDESQTKTIKRIERGFRAMTYNLEVENTHCLMANGVIAHNSMDAIRYGLTSIIPIIRRRDYLNSFRQNPPKERSNVGL